MRAHINELSDFGMRAAHTSRLLAGIDALPPLPPPPLRRGASPGRTAERPDSWSVMV